MHHTSVLDLRLGSTVGRSDVGRVVSAVVAHLATLADTPVDLFDALDAACHELTDVPQDVPIDYQPTWAFWLRPDGFGVAATCACGRDPDQLPLARAMGDVSTEGATVWWQVGGSADHTPVPPEPLVDDGRVLTMRVPASFEHAAAVRAMVRSVVDFPDGDEEARYLIAATEIFTNAVRASHRRSDPPPVEIDVVVADLGSPSDSRAGTGVPALTITDRCGGWDPSSIGPVDRESGLSIARAFVPGLSHTPIEGGCSVALPFPPEP
jgi:hypothetical protein